MMTLIEGKRLLDSNNIPFSELRFNNTADYWLYKNPLANTEKADKNPVTLLVVSSNNQKKNIELLFADENNDGNDTFIDLYFGQYFYDLLEYEDFDCEEDLQQAIVNEINRVMKNDIIVVAKEVRKKAVFHMLAFYDKKENIPGIENMMKEINKKKGLFAKLFGPKTQYEIYDWNSYQCIVKG